MYVVVLDTRMGAAVDVDGAFFIINVPPGTYTLEVSMIGYISVQQTEVRVSIDRTTPVNVELSQTEVEMEAIVVTAPRTGVKLDVSQSEVTVTEEQMAVVPLVTDVTSYMSLQAGVDVGGDEESSEMFIRGGGNDQIGMVVDGLVLSNNLTGGIFGSGEDDEGDLGGGPLLNLVNLGAIQEVSVIRGGFNAEYGNIRSGLFNVVTKEGQRRIGASVDARYGFPRQKHRGPGLYDFNNYHVRPYVDPAVCWVGTQNGDWDEYTQGQYLTFQGWNAFVEPFNSDEDPDNDISAEEARNMYIWQHALEGSGALGHPHEGDYGNTPDWNVDLSLHGPLPLLSNALGNMRYFLSYRYNLESYTFPAQLDGVTTNNFLGKIHFNISPTMKMSLQGIYGKTETAGGAAGGDPGRGAYFLHTTSPMDIYSRVLGITFDHTLGPRTFYSVRFSYVNVENDQNQWRVERDPTILRNFGPFGLDEQPWGYGPIEDPGYVYALADRQVIGGVGAADVNLSKISTFNIKADLTSQVNRHNLVQAGVELIFDDMDVFIANRDIDVTGNFVNEWQSSPFRIQGYIQDKLEFNDFVANVGLRLDYNSPNSVWYGVDPYNKYFSRAFKDQFVANVPSEDAKPHTRLSPRLGVAHPITTKSKLFFSYGHFYDMAGAFDRFGINFGIDAAGIAGIGNPTLLPRKTIAYELGYEHELGNQYLVRLTGYYRDVTNQIGAVNYVNFDESVNYTTFSNDEFADIRGFEIELRKDWGNWLTGWFNYTYMVTTNGLIGREFQFQDPREQKRNSLRNPLDDLEKPLPQPYANANIRVMSPAKWGPALGGIHIFDRLSLNSLVSWNSGDYWTYAILSGDRVANNIQWKDQWGFDLRISKFFNISNFDFNFFLDIRNVLDLKYLTPDDFYFASEADLRDYIHSLRLPQYAEERYQNAGLNAGNDQVGDYRSEDKPYINMPNLDHLAWNTPRSVILGLRIGF
jgi:outer membrane receptor protein involved in Fe transport